MNKSTDDFPRDNNGPATQCRGVTGVAQQVRDLPRWEFAINLRQALKRIFLLFLVSSIAAGCSLQMVTKPSIGERQPANIQPGGESSNIGALQASADSVTNENIIRPGDQIQVTVWGYPEFNTTTTVKDFGSITVPLIGEVIAAGLTVSQLKAELTQRLSEYVKGKARITVSHIGMDKQVSVMGAVTRQGNYPALTELTLVEVLADAGGATTTADLRHIKIYRHSLHSEVVNVDLDEYLQSGNIQYIPRVGPGDVVFVPEQQNFVAAFSTYASEVVFLFGFFALLR